MGLELSHIKYLYLARQKFAVHFDSFLMLGRQNLKVSNKSLQAMLSNIGIPGVGTDFFQKDGFSETLIKKLFDAKEVDSLDYSDYENATIIWDLNKPIQSEYEQRFDCVLDGGTLEHVFNYPVALQNAMRLCKVGGHLIIQTPANNCCNHGFYQFSPTLLADVLDNNGFELKDVSLVDCFGLNYKVYPGVPQEMLPMVNNSMMMYAVAKRKGEIPQELCAYQGTYRELWGAGCLEHNKERMIELYDIDREIGSKEHDYKMADRLYGKKVLLYGAGRLCRIYMDNEDYFNKVEIIGIADQCADSMKGINIAGYKISELKEFDAKDFDYIVLMVRDSLANEIRRELRSGYGIDQEKVLNLSEYLNEIRACDYYNGSKLYS